MRIRFIYCQGVQVVEAHCHRLERDGSMDLLRSVWMLVIVCEILLRVRSQAMQMQCQYVCVLCIHSAKYFRYYQMSGSNSPIFVVIHFYLMSPSVTDCALQPLVTKKKVSTLKRFNLRKHFVRWHLLWRLSLWEESKWWMRKEEIEQILVAHIPPFSTIYLYLHFTDDVAKIILPTFFFCS